MTAGPGERAFALAACAAMFLWPVVTTDFDHVNAVSVLVAAGAVLFGALTYFRKTPPWLVLAFAACAGIALRLTTPPYSGSDVAAATAEALKTFAAHANPYRHYFATTHPPGQPFPYLPGELALYAIQQWFAGSLADHDRWWGIGTVAALAALAPACGYGRTALATALFAVSSTNVLMGIDGSNDTGLLFLLAVAVLALAYAVRAAGAGRSAAAAAAYAASAVFFGWALAFKALVWIALPFALRALAPQRRRAYAGLAILVALLFCLPFLILSPADLIRSVAAGFTSHQNVWGFNVWSALAASHPQAMDALTKYTLTAAIFATLFTASTLWTRKPGTLGEALLQSCVVLAVMLLFARWTSLAYYAFLIGAFALAIATFALGPEGAQAADVKR